MAITHNHRKLLISLNPVYSVSILILALISAACSTHSPREETEPSKRIATNQLTAPAADPKLCKGVGMGMKNIIERPPGKSFTADHTLIITPYFTGVDIEENYYLFKGNLSGNALQQKLRKITGTCTDISPPKSITLPNGRDISQAKALSLILSDDETDKTGDLAILRTIGTTKFYIMIDEDGEELKKVKFARNSEPNVFGFKLAELAAAAGISRIGNVKMVYHWRDCGLHFTYDDEDEVNYMRMKKKDPHFSYSPDLHNLRPLVNNSSNLHRTVILDNWNGSYDNKCKPTSKTNPNRIVKSYGLNYYYTYQMNPTKASRTDPVIGNDGSGDGGP